MYRISTRLIFLFSFCCIAASLPAQNGSYDLRMKLQSFDCAQKRAVIELQIRAADVRHTFLMGEASFRFEYNPLAMSTPYLIDQENFSLQAPASDLNYKLQNMDGSIERPELSLVSLNIVYSGVQKGAKLVDTSWTKISTIGFEMLELDSCYTLVWHDDQNAPITVVNEVIFKSVDPFDYQFKAATTSGYYENLQFCAPAECRNQAVKAKENPVAQNDTVRLSMNEVANIFVLKNDSVKGSVASLKISSVSRYGDLVVNPDFTISYIPQHDFCGDDQFSYALCNNSGGCDTAKVFISIDCQKIRVYTGFSPNGDGVNDFLVIHGLEEFPNNRLKVFSRWGTEVYTVNGYKNDWAGTWKGSVLPVGTYFYVLDNGAGQNYSGYVELQR